MICLHYVSADLKNAWLANRQSLLRQDLSTNSECRQLVSDESHVPAARTMFGTFAAHFLGIQSLRHAQGAGKASSVPGVFTHIRHLLNGIISVRKKLLKG